MPSIITKIVFSEPAGRPNSWVQFALSLSFLGIYAWSVSNGVVSNWLLIMSAGSALSGIAESFSKDRHLAAGVFRLAAAFVFVCLLATMFFAPEFIVG